MQSRRSSYQFDGGDLSCDGGDLSCLEWHDPDAPLLLFAHANGFNAQTYRTVLAPLAGCFHILACDLRGHGLSTLPAPPGLAKDWAVFRDDLVALLELLPPAPVILAGHSMGATANLMAAALRPSRVRALVLVEPVLLPEHARGETGGANPLAQRAAQRRSTFPSLAAAFDAYRGRGIFASWPDAVLRDYLAGGTVENADGTLRLACEPDWEAEIFREPPSDPAALAGSVACPMTIIHGTINSTAWPQQLAAIAQCKPDTRIIAVEGGSHFLPMEQPEPVREEIRRAAAAA